MEKKEKEYKILEERLMSNKEIAEWGGITESYFSKNRNKWCEKVLSQYAEYELKRGYVNILEVINPIRNPKVKKQIEKNWDKCWGTKDFPVDTCKRAAKKMRPLIKFEGKIKSETFYDYVCATKRDLFGVPKKRGGRWGTSKWVFCKVRTDTGDACPFTGDELDMKKKLQERYFGNGYEKYEELKAARIALKRKEITKEDYDKVLEIILDYDKDWEYFEEDFTNYLNRDSEKTKIYYELDCRTYVEEDAILMIADGAIEPGKPLTEEQKAFFNS